MAHSCACHAEYVCLRCRKQSRVEDAIAHISKTLTLLKAVTPHRPGDEVVWDKLDSLMDILEKDVEFLKR